MKLIAPRRLMSRLSGTALFSLAVAFGAIAAPPANADWPPFPPDNTPLCDPSLPVDFAYRGQADANRGLYPDGTNAPSGDLLAVLERRHAEIEPIDGVIVMAAIGMSNTTQAFGAFERDVRFREHNARLVTANLAMAGSDVRIQAGTDPGDPFSFCQNWDDAHPDEVEIGETCGLRHRAFWRTALTRLEAYGIDPNQVQVIWVGTTMDAPSPELSEIEDCSSGPCWRTEIEEVAAGWGKIITGRLSEFFPNLKVVYLSGRNYGGYQQEGIPPVEGNPEPFSYEVGFAVKWFLQNYETLIGLQGGPDQFTGPAVAWGPYLWTNGNDPRSCDLAYDPPGGLFWLRSDFDGDGFHPLEPGETKVSALIGDYLSLDPLAAEWFLPPEEEDAESFVLDAIADTVTNGFQTGPDQTDIPLAPGFSGFVQLPTDALDPGAKVVSAKLMLRMDSSRESRLLDVQQIEAGWAEDASPAELLGLETLAPIYTHPVSPTTVGDPDGSIGIDVTAAVEEAMLTGETLAFRISARFNPCVAGFLSREYSHPARVQGDPPYLAVVTE